MRADGIALMELALDLEMAGHTLELLGIDTYGHRAKIKRALRTISDVKSGGRGSI
eukprot:SAG31_NODE_2778_length_5104_cov_2.424775_5_plen_55_part_00